MMVFYGIFMGMLGALGVTLMILELLRKWKARMSCYLCVCFSEELLESKNPDMIIICRNDAEQEEILRRISENESRKVYIKRW